MRNILLAILLCGVYANSNAIKTDEFKTLEEEWDAYKLKYDKKYSNPEEDRLRKSLFSESFHKTVKHNKLYHQGEETYLMAINKFADLTKEERARYNGYIPTKIGERGMAKTAFTPRLNAVVPDELDWRTGGAVTEVKDAGGNCNSAWAFSAVGALEGQYFQKTGKLVNMSAQNLIDCCDQGKNDGCNGGDPLDAFAYVYFNDGIDSEDAYPYAGKEQVCNYTKADNVTSVKFFVEVGVGKEYFLKEAVAFIGPISANIHADITFFLYDSGVYYNKYCKRRYDHLDHSVLVVGYGSTQEEPPVDYWLVKNCWEPNGERMVISGWHVTERITVE